ncbi:MAG: hypothetical protein ACR2KE_04005 [Candidatus Nanopelagicales bacterium]
MTTNQSLAISETSILVESPGEASDIARRAIVAVGLVGIALVHLLDVQGKLEEVPYLGFAYIGLIIASLVLADLNVRRGGRMVYAASAGLAAAVIIGYAINRTVGMPGAMDDIGNWWEPLGLASLLVEATVVWFAITGWMRKTF